MSNGIYDFEGNAIPKEIFKKKLKHGELYCEEHDAMKDKGTKWDSGPFDAPHILVYVCHECIKDSMEALEHPRGGFKNLDHIKDNHEAN